MIHFQSQNSFYKCCHNRNGYNRRDSRYYNHFCNRRHNRLNCLYNRHTHYRYHNLLIPNYNRLCNHFYKYRPLYLRTRLRLFPALAGTARSHASASCQQRQICPDYLFDFPTQS